MPKKGKVQCFDMKHYVTQKLAAEKAAEVKNMAATVASASPASSSNHLQVGKGKEMNEYDIQKLHGLKYMLSRKKAGATLQEKQRRQEDVQIAKELAALQKQISKDEKSKSSELNEAQLAFLANKQAEGEVIDERAFDPTILDESAVVSEASKNEPSKNDIAMYEALARRSEPTETELLQYRTALDLMHQERQLAEETKKEKQEVIKHLKELQKAREKNKAREKLGLELMENSAKKALKFIQERERAQKEKALIAEFKNRNKERFFQNVSPSLPPEEGEEEQEYYDYYQTEPDNEQQEREDEFANDSDYENLDYYAQPSPPNSHQGSAPAQTRKSRYASKNSKRQQSAANNGRSTRSTAASPYFTEKSTRPKRSADNEALRDFDQEIRSLVASLSN